MISQILNYHPSKRGNQVSSDLNFKISRGGAWPRTPLEGSAFGGQFSEPPLTKCWIRPRRPHQLRGTGGSENKNRGQGDLVTKSRNLILHFMNQFLFWRFAEVHVSWCILQSLFPEWFFTIHRPIKKDKSKRANHRVNVETANLLNARNKQSILESFSPSPGLLCSSISVL